MAGKPILMLVAVIALAYLNFGEASLEPDNIDTNLGETDENFNNRELDNKDLAGDDVNMGEPAIGDLDIEHVGASARQVDLRCTVVCTKWNVCAVKYLLTHPKKVIKKCGLPPLGCRCLGFVG